MPGEPLIRRITRLDAAAAAVSTVAILAVAGCRGDCSSPAAPPAPAPRLAAGRYPAELLRLAPPPAGEHRWTWRGAGPDQAAPGGGGILLTVDGRSWNWRPATTPGDTCLPGTMLLRPEAPDQWHEFLVATDSTLPGGWMPLPRVAAASAHYADLLHLVQELTRPRFDGVVTHWSLESVPVGCGPAVSGAVDLAVCLREAVATWRLAGEPPLLAWDGESALGARLIHYPGVVLHPPMSVQMVRRDKAGRVLRVHIRCGDTYDGPQDVRYARRALVHELGHVLLLWGHSEDRTHVLWRNGPIVDRPADDELRAAALWRALPEGLDLKRYGRSTELQPQRQQGEGPPVQQPGLDQDAAVGELLPGAGRRADRDRAAAHRL